jgi:predicted ATP-dependent endonuclease of OLD family
MKLRKVEFINYKSILSGVLDIENDITCLVGINESGKSNVLFALEKADIDEELTAAEYSRHSADYGSDENSPELKLWFEPLEEELDELKKIFGHNEVSTILLTKIKNKYRLDYPKIEYEKSGFAKKEAEESETPRESQPQEIQNTDNEKEEDKKITEEEIRGKVEEELKNYIPRFLRFDSVAFDEYFLPENGEVQISQFIANPDGMRPVKNLLILGGISDFNILQASDGNQRIKRDKLLGTASQKINREILRFVWPVESVEVDLSAESDILKIRLKEKGKTSPFKPIERSRGLQWALAFNIYFLAETKDRLQKSVLLIDEPGIFLHIDAQNKLLGQTFPEISGKGNQIIYTTHLPYLIDSRFPERIRILEKEDEDTIIGNKAWSEGEFSKIPEPVKTALGLRWSELFNLTEKNVIVEGPSDQIILRHLHSLFGKDETINFLPAYGYRKFPSVLANIKIEEKLGFGLTDGDADLEKVRKKCSIVSVQDDEVENIPTLVNNKDIITLEDVLPEDILKEAIFSVYKIECERRKNCSLSKEEISIEYPRVKKLEEFFAKKFKAKKHKLAKMEIARAVADFLNGNKNAKGEKWKVAKTLIEQIERRCNQKQGEES